MRVTTPDARSEGWLHRPLCRRYAAIIFSPISGPPIKTAEAQNRTICWAFGCVINGDSEILGAWITDDAMEASTAVLDALQARGVEAVRCVIGAVEGGEPTLLARFRDASLYPSVERSIVSRMAEVRAVHRLSMSQQLRAQVGHPDHVPDMSAAPAFSSEDLWQKYPEILANWPCTVAALETMFELPQPYRRLLMQLERSAGELQARLTKSIRRRVRFADSGEAFEFVADWLMRADLRLERDRRALLMRDAADASAPRRGVSAPVAAIRSALG